MKLPTASEFLSFLCAAGLSHDALADACVAHESSEEVVIGIGNVRIRARNDRGQVFFDLGAKLGNFMYIEDVMLAMNSVGVEDLLQLDRPLTLENIATFFVQKWDEIQSSFGSDFYMSFRRSVAIASARRGNAFEATLVALAREFKSEKGRGRHSKPDR